MAQSPIKVAWFSYFPVEWLPGMPDEVSRLPRQHAASWQRVLLNELQSDPELKLHIVVLRKQFPRNLTFDRNGVTFHLVKTLGGTRAPSLFWADTILIGRVLRQVKPDVVHAWGTEHGAALVANRLGYPRVATVQGLFTWYVRVALRDWHSRLAARLEDYTLSSPKTQCVTTEARFSVNYLRQRYPRLRVEQVEHAPDPVFHRIERRPQTTPVRFVFVGAFDHRKGADVLAGALDAVREEIPFECIVIGKARPDYLEQVRQRVSPALWQRISFRENLTHLDVAGELSTATIMLCPTRADVSPNAVKEAVVAGVPVVGTNVGGIPDYVFPDKNGVLCAPDDLPAFAEAIRCACRHPLFGQGRVEETTLEQVREYLSPKLMARKFRDIYRRLATGTF
ncbi:MAG: glycosyltransferase family 4 protein [Verrucomicrobiae bacterium]|nr:glycosyltransferase family 4 protein [Verrucomicrobiae bacterium]